ncbi:MAG: right-handed parallel beta-helix repeat-containing protein [Planctomycetota bacterium]|nr:right-handed parallel beta-helix repeat-containing protein [Planctomycetota bacterium]
MRYLSFCILSIAALLPLASCDRFVPPTPPGVDVGSVPDGGGLGSSGLAIVTHPRFGGITDLVAGDSMVRIGWEQANDDETPPDQIEYLIFVTPDNTPFNLEDPTAVVIGITQLEIENLQNGELLRVLVQARDSDLEVDPNKNQWLATPNPVRYVRSGASPNGSDGLTAESAFPSMAQAVAMSIPLNGVNFYVAGGLYPENIFLFTGMMLFGGFNDQFEVAQRDPDTFLTQFGIGFPNDLVNLRPGHLLSGIDGISLSGNNIAESCVHAEDCLARITRCRLSGAITQGIDLRSDSAEGETIRALIADCVISDCSGEGIRIQGIPQIRIDNCEIRNNLNEGIESQWIQGTTLENARIEITRCNIHSNGDEGIDLDIAAVPANDQVSSIDARIRIRIRNCTIDNNALEGIVIDLDTLPSDQMDVRVRIDDCSIRANGLAGIFLDGDSDAALRVARCQITANGADGLLITGLAGGPMPQIQHSNLLGNAGAGLATEGLGCISAWHCWIEGNGGGLTRSQRGSISIHDSILSCADESIDPSSFHYCILDGQWIPADGADHLLSGSLEVVARPAQYARATVEPDGSLQLLELIDSIEGLSVEVSDDGILRQMTSIVGPHLTVDPPVNPTLRPVSLFFWLPQDGPIEDPTPSRDSSLIGAADPATLNNDGTPHDLGPLGANPLHFVGPDPALPDSPDQNQLRFISPAPSVPAEAGHWILSFTRDVSFSALSKIIVSVDGVDRSDTLARFIIGNNIDLRLIPAPLPGQETRLQILPFDGDKIGDSHSRRLLFDQRMALVVTEDETLAQNDFHLSAPHFDAEPIVISGSIGSLDDEDWFRITPPSDGLFQVELLARREESLLAGHLEWYSSDGLTLLGSSQATAPYFFDPFLIAVAADPSSGSILLRVTGSADSVTSGHGYRLLLQSRNP